MRPLWRGVFSGRLQSNALIEQRSSKDLELLLGRASIPRFATSELL